MGPVVLLRHHKDLWEVLTKSPAGVMYRQISGVGHVEVAKAK